MGLTFGNGLAWLTAFAIVFSLYAHTVLQLDSAEVTPVLAVVIAAGLGLSAVLWLRYPAFVKPIGTHRQAAAFVFVAAWLGLVVFGLAGFSDRMPTTRDWGLFLLTVGVPPMLLLNRERPVLLKSIGWWCVVFALLDAIANIGACLGFWAPNDAGGRIANAVLIQRYGGLTGNSHAGGIVGLVAVCYISTRLRQPRRLVGWLLATVFLVMIGVSLYLTDARRYTGEAILAGALLAVPAARLLPLQYVSVAMGAAGVQFAFTHFDSDNNQRANLMASGWRESLSHLWAGEGLFYREAPAGVGFNDLWSVHVTESGILDLSIAFGWFSTLLLLLSCMIALSSPRSNLTWPIVLLCVFCGELAYGDPIDGFLGAILFFGAFLFALNNEEDIN